MIKSTEKITQMIQDRQNFLNGINPRPQNVRPEILESWIRCRSQHVDPESIVYEILSQEQLSKRIQERALLYETAMPIMKSLFNFVKDSNCMLILSDEEGYILKILADKSISQHTGNQFAPLLEGTNRKESFYGTNAIGTPLITRKPLQIHTYEHYCIPNTQWTCSGSPIIDKQGLLLGCLCLSGTWDNFHPHTLGMVVTATVSIEQQLELKHIHHNVTLIQEQLQTTIDSYSQGIFLLNHQYQIQRINMLASKILDYEESNIIGRPVTDFFNKIHFEDITENCYDKETIIRSRNGQIPCFLSVHITTTTNNSNQPLLILFFRETKYMRKMINRYIGSNARFTFDDILGDSESLLKAKQMAKLVAPTHSNVLLLGESGTGKELFAQSIHNASAYSNGPFITVNCGAIPKSLIESELFGYESGSFTGAKREGNAGKFELANGGTIFLDEIGDMPYDVQISLLRIIQTKEIIRIGGKKAIPIDVRIIAATNVDLDQAIKEKTFRQDLFYRLNVFNIRIPPLRERNNDVLLLAEHFIRKYQLPDRSPIIGISDSAKQILSTYSWPGNIRELENAMERACILTTTRFIEIDSLPYNLSEKAVLKDHDVLIPALDDINETSFTSSIAENEKTLIIQHIIAENGNMKKAADTLGISRRTLYRKIKRYEINCNEIRNKLKQS